MFIVNIERGLPAADEALSRLSLALREAKAGRHTAVKVIHGYGSSGKGGVIKSRLRGFLADRKRKGQISAFVPGEDFTPFTDGGRLAVDRCRELSRDSDYGAGNPGITVILL